MAHFSRHRSPRHVQAFAELLGRDEDGTARAWVHARIAREAHQLAFEAEKIALLREEIEGVSPVLVAACAAEGLPIALVAHALIGFAHWPERRDGWPWAEGPEAVVGRNEVGAGAEAAPAAVSSLLEHNIASLAFVKRNRDDGAFIRAFEHHLGGWAASVRRGTLGTEIVRGGTRIRTVGDRGMLTFAAELPHAIAIALRGRLVSEVVDHPALRGPGLVITSAKIGVGATTIRFRCPVIRTDFDSLCGAHRDLKAGCDIAHQDEHALLRLLASEVTAAGPDAGPSVVHARLACRIEASEPRGGSGGPSATTPDLAWVEAAMRPAMREVLDLLSSGLRT